MSDSKRILFWTIVLAAAVGIGDAAGCSSSEAQMSCGACLKEGPECAWCTDPDFKGAFRCAEVDDLRAQCRADHVYQVLSKITIQEERAIGSPRPHDGGGTQLQPQVVLAEMKPGEFKSFVLRYHHLDPQRRYVEMANSEVVSKGLSLTFRVECQGTWKDGPACDDVNEGSTLTYNVTVGLTECLAGRSGTEVVSVGMGGVRDVVALYVTPLCGCECESLGQAEEASPRCNSQGRLICGKCVCPSGKSGRHCECDASGLSAHSSTDESCKATPDAAVVCSGHGKCSCGVCECEDGWGGEACDCEMSEDKCIGPNGEVCSGSGTCKCGKCQCHTEGVDEMKKSGQFCEVCEDCGAEGSSDSPTEEPGGEEEDDGTDEEPTAEPDSNAEGATSGASARSRLCLLPSVLVLVGAGLVARL